MPNFNPYGTRQSHDWNYSKPQDSNGNPRDDYSTELVGTVRNFQFVQGIVYMSNPPQPQTWPDGNPKFNIRMNLIDPNGKLKCFTFTPAGKRAIRGEKKSIHLDLFALAGGVDIDNLKGKTIRITTQPGQYGSGSPRPFNVELLPNVGPFEPSEPISAEYDVAEVLQNQGASGGRVAPQQPYAQPMYQQQPQQAYVQPMQQQVYQAAPVQQMAPQMAPQQPMQPQAAPMPQGMNPQVANAIQQMGATNVAPMPQQPNMNPYPEVNNMFN